MKVKDLKNVLIGVVSKYVSREEAIYFAEETIETDIRKSPRKKFSDDMIRDIKSWEGKEIKVEKTINLPGYTQWNFNGLGPSLKIKEIHDDLVKKASVNGIAMTSIINSGGMHVMHLWTQGLAKQGLFAVCSWNGGPDAVVPINGTRGLFGTNPLTYAFPSDNGTTVIDMATSEIPYFKIIEATKNNTPLPENTVVDSNGELTTNPKKGMDSDGVSNLLPMGGNYKGYNINYLFEIMTSALIGARISAEMSNDYIETEHGGFIIAIDIGKVTSREKYNVSVKKMNEKIRAQKPKSGVDKVIVPGDTNLARLDGITDDSEIEVDEEYLATLKSL